MERLKQLESALIKADAAGNVDDARVLAAEIRSMRANLSKQTPTIGDGQGLLRQFANSASFGFDDELAGAASYLTGGDYASARDAYRKERDQYAKGNPAKSFAAGLAGGLATGIGGAGKAAATKIGKSAIDAYRNAGAMGRFGANVASGAATGALSGLGNADDGSRMSGATKGAIIGGATGALVSPVAYVARKAADVVAPVARWAKDKATMSAEEQFARKLAQQAERDGLTPGQVQAKLSKLGPDAMLADVGENIRGLAEGYALLPGEAKRAANASLMNRAKGQASRVTNSLMDSLDAPDINFDQQIQSIHANMREAGKGYAPIIDTKEVPVTPEMERLLTGPTMKSALARAYHIAQNDVALGDADSTVQKFFALNDKGEGMFVPFTGMHGEIKQRPTLRVWDYAKRGLDAIIGDGTDPITGKLTNEARQALLFKKRLLSDIDAAAPEYAKVRSEFADEASIETALKMGRAFFSKDAEVTMRHMADMSEPEKNMFRAGAARAARDKILSAPDTGDAYKRVFGNQLTRDKLRAVFPDAKSFTKFARSIQREAAFSQTKNAILGNSRTAAREALKDDTGIDPSVLLDFAQGKVGALTARLASSRLQSAMEVPEVVRNAGAQYLFSTDPATKAKGLQLLTSQAGLLGSRRALPRPSPYAPLTAGLLGMQVGQ